MNRKLAVVAALGFLAASAITPAIAQQGVTDTEILLGDILPLTGPPALLGVAHNLGVKVAVAEANAAGGINGRKLRLISEDDGYVPSRTVQGVRKLITSDKVFALTSLSGTAQGQAALPVVRQAGIPTMATISLFEELYKPVSKNVFAIGGDHESATAGLVAKVADKFPGKKWAIISQDDDYGELVRQGFELVQKEKKLSVVSSQIYKKGQADFSSEILKVKQSGAEVLMAGGVLGENVAMAKELERNGFKIPMAVTYVSRVPASVKLMGAAGENVYTVDFVTLEESPRGKAFMEKVKQHLTPEEMGRVNRYTFTGYAGARTLFEAMKRCGKSLTWDCTNAELAKTQNFDTGVMSPISFSATQHLAAPALFLMRSDPASVSYKPVE
ncbi:ABC transporter substrate-binding protein [Variovorax guangxiensis]|uniref:ABC transporter substrate-binding protein n=1 Tax=Variovorax guangxiensis TaxID=1775474 RepID=UPI0028611B5E|nr:ABC transporter substrate-binding protein [Variovorax guangxiensis]MDR6861102.1 ABC-type branched-subunit amino acid transport system substrate-binding protein [Variovorax guangxiensis]